jgi:hypothetical protein
VVPNDIKAATAYRDFFELLTEYAGAGLQALRAVNPITKGRPAASITHDD